MAQILIATSCDLCTKLIFFFCRFSPQVDSWRIVTPGAIDGYSRLITYLCASTNNEAKTVYELFLSAVQKHQLPSRVRSDQGTENVLVAQHMIEKRGAERHSMITASSVHNQHIERLWRDMHKSITILFYKLFYFLEHHSLLDHLNERHLWALQYVFVPRINCCSKNYFLKGQIPLASGYRNFIRILAMSIYLPINGHPANSKKNGNLIPVKTKRMKVL